MVICWAGLIASVWLFELVAARVASDLLRLLLSFVSAAQDFSGYQSDGMLLEAGFIALFFAPRWILARAWPRRTRLRAEPFSPAVGMVSDLLRIGRGEDGEPRFLVAPFHRDGRLLSERSTSDLDWLVCAASPALVPRFAVGLHVCRRTGSRVDAVSSAAFRIVCFCIVTPFQISIILTANYAFLNYLVLALGFLLLGRSLRRVDSSAADS